jgi:hypothetical protein
MRYFITGLQDFTILSKRGRRLFRKVRHSHDVEAWDRWHGVEAAILLCGDPDFPEEDRDHARLLQGFE